MNDLNHAETSPIRMPEFTASSSSNMFDSRNMVIIGLIILLILAVLGINLLSVSGNVLQNITNIFEPFIINILSLIGYGSGTIINKTADVAGDVSKLGIDIAEGTVHSIGDLLKNSSNPHVDDNTKRSFDNVLNFAKPPPPPPPPETPPPAKEGFSSMQTSWNYDGENQEKYGYINVSDYSKCISGQIFPSQTMVLNPLLFEQNR